MERGITAEYTYTLIESIIKVSIPLWELSLSPLGRNGCHFKHSLLIHYNEVVHGPVPFTTTDNKEEEENKADEDDEEDAESYQDTDHGEDNEDNSEPEEDEYSHLSPIDRPLILPESSHTFSPLLLPPPLSFKNP